MNTEQRKLKIGYGTRESGTYYKHITTTPKLILQGNWFERAGFVVGQFVKVVVADNIIQIIRETTPAYEIPEMPGDEVLADFTKHQDDLHYEGYSDNLRKHYPTQFEEMLTEYKTNYSL